MKIFTNLIQGRDLVNDFSDDDDDVTNNDVTSQKIEIIEDVSTPTRAPRKPSLIVDMSSHRHQARKRSVTFEPVDVASLKLTSQESQTEEDEGQEKEVSTFVPLLSVDVHITWG